MTTSVLDGVPGPRPGASGRAAAALRVGQAPAGRVGRGDRVGAGHGGQDGGGGRRRARLSGSGDGPGARVGWHAGRMSDEPSPITVPAGIPALEAATEAPHLSQPQVLIITGMSGAGPDASGRGAGGPRLVRHRQPAGPDAHAPGRHADQWAGGCASAAARRRDRRPRTGVLPGPGTGAGGAAGVRGRVPHPVPRRVRRGAGPPVRAGPPAAPAAGSGPHPRRHRGGARDPRRPAGARGHPHRHVRAQRARPRARGPGRRRQRRRGRAADLDRLVRVQVRDPARRRPRGRHAVPVQPLLDHRAAAPDRPRRSRAGLRARAAGRGRPSSTATSTRSSPCSRGTSTRRSAT